MITPLKDTVSVSEVSQANYNTPPYELLNLPHQEAHEQVNLCDVVAFISDKMATVKQGKRINNSVASITGFLKEVMKRAQINKNILLLASIYFKNLVSSYKEELPDFACCGKRLLLVCLILAHKFSNDMTFSMRTWTQVSGLPTMSISIMERWCLKQLNYGLYINNETLASWTQDIAGYHKRNFSTTPMPKKRSIDTQYNEYTNKRARRSIV
ncbi:PHO85 cyclin-5 [Nakaseomyces bracarensis]|uniref:PHO85 cyclin-5 n=1 Tax=Nakaseomyces bracarensis TaxID=273131 RepID=A0ABR4P020_9SACH